jgi:4'-phosphopantetheinyl transferase EntD
MPMPPGENLIARVSVPGAFGVEIEDCGQAVPTHPDEDVWVASSSPARRREFALGRFCARAALIQMGAGDVVIAPGPDGAPVWPAGIVGSITHTAGYAAAIVGSRSDFLGIGVDAERIGGVTEHLFPKLFDSQERALLATLDEEKRCLVSTIFFSAKEAYFKAWRPVNGKPLSFQDIHVVWEGERFHANQDQGLVAISGGLVVTSVLLR